MPNQLTGVISTEELSTETLRTNGRTLEIRNCSAIGVISAAWLVLAEWYRSYFNFTEHHFCSFQFHHEAKNSAISTTFVEGRIFGSVQVQREHSLGRSD
jgi:hypothetical protein